MSNLSIELFSYRHDIPAYYKDVDAVIIVYDVSEDRTFNELPDWVKEAKAHTEGVPIVLVGNKFDLARDISYDQGKQFSDSNGLNFYIETSAKEGNNIDRLFEDLTKIILSK